MSSDHSGVNTPNSSSFLKAHPTWDAKFIDDTFDGHASVVNTKPCGGSRPGSLKLVGVDGAWIDIPGTLGDTGRPAEGRALGNIGASFPEVSVKGRVVSLSKPSDETLLTSSSAVPRRWKLLHRIQRLCTPADPMKRGPAVCGCGLPGPDATSVNIHLRSGAGGTARASVTGVYRCHSPWLCPTCAPGKATERAERVQRVADATYEQGGAVALVVLTASHRLSTPLADLAALVAGASRKARQGRTWVCLTERYGILGTVVGKEVTISREHGWHYHQHLSVIVAGRDGESDDDTRARAQAAGDALAERYKAMIRAAGGKVSDKHGCRVRVADDAEDASKYTAKGSAAWEVAGGPGKDETKAGVSMTPWDLAESAYRTLKDGGKASREDRWARTRWSEYVAEMPGTRSCAVTASLAKALGIDAAADDEDDETGGEQVLHDSDEVVARVAAPAWKCWMRFGLAAAFLARIERDGEIGCATAIAETVAEAGKIKALLDERRAARETRIAEDAATRAAATRAHLAREAAARIGIGAGTRTTILRAIDALAAANPGLEPLSPAEVVAAMPKAA